MKYFNIAIYLILYTLAGSLCMAAIHLERIDLLTLAGVMYIVGENIRKEDQ